jgi:hypothetical protein
MLSAITRSYVAVVKPFGHSETWPVRISRSPLNDRATMLTNGNSVSTTTPVSAIALKTWNTRYDRVGLMPRGRAGLRSATAVTGVTTGSSPPCAGRSGWPRTP